jgi:hypothetical protein
MNYLARINIAKGKTKQRYCQIEVAPVKPDSLASAYTHMLLATLRQWKGIDLKASDGIRIPFLPQI